MLPVLLGIPWPALRGPLRNQFWKKRRPQPYWGGENSGNALEASNALNYRVWGIPAVLSREIPGNALKAFPGSFRNFFRKVPAVLGATMAQLQARNQEMMYLTQTQKRLKRDFFLFLQRYSKVTKKRPFEPQGSLLSHVGGQKVFFWSLLSLFVERFNCVILFVERFNCVILFVERFNCVILFVERFNCAILAGPKVI